MLGTKKRIAVIGAGASGLAAIHCCREDDLDVVCFEKTGNYGGLWRYHDEDINGIASVMKSTIINTSKEVNAFSDFPPPKEFPNYMHNSMMLRYFELYAEHFGLPKYIRFHHEIVKVRKSVDFAESGRWIVKYRDLTTNNEEEEIFDGVMICTGHHVQPQIAHFPGEEDFQGSIIHSHSYKKHTGYQDKYVVVVGVGNSGCDVAAELATISKKVYLSTRRGCWVQPRMVKKGIPYDIHGLRRYKMLQMNLLPYNKVCDIMEKDANDFLDHDLYKLKPKHRILSQHPTVNDLLPNRIISGLVVVKGNIKKITRTGVIFEDDDDKETPVDAIVLATGYRISFPFLDDDVIPVKDNQVNLYKYVFPPDLEKPTLAVIGLVQPRGSIFTLSEMHARWFASVMTDRVKLPSKEQMWKDITRKQEELAKRYVGTPRHTIQVEWLHHMDEIASQFGAKPNLLRLALTDPKLFYAVFFGPGLSYHYRLYGPHPWPGARDAILKVEERISGPFETRKIEEDNMKKSIMSFRRCLMGVFAVGVAGFAFLAYTDNFDAIKQQGFMVQKFLTN